MENVVLWCGEPLTEMSHERLIEIISDLAAENRRLSEALTERSVKHVHDLADMGKRLQMAQSPLIVRLLGPYFGPAPSL